MPLCRCTARGCNRVEGGVSLDNRTYCQHQRDEGIFQKSRLHTPVPMTSTDVRSEAEIAIQAAVFQTTFFDNPIPFSIHQADALHSTSFPIIQTGQGQLHHASEELVTGTPSGFRTKAEYEESNESKENPVPDELKPLWEEIENLISTDAHLRSLIKTVTGAMADPLLGCGTPRILPLYPLNHYEEEFIGHSQYLHSYLASKSAVVQLYSEELLELLNSHWLILRNHRDTRLAPGMLIYDTGE